MSQLQTSSEIVTSPSQRNLGLDYFGEVLKEAGIKLKSDDNNILVQEQALVVRDIEKILNRNNLQENIQQFMNGVRLLCNTEKYFRKALMPTKLVKIINDNMEEIQQESLFRIFLKVNYLQSETIKYLLNEITTIATEDQQDTSRLRLLLNQLQFLPLIQNPKQLTSKLLDILEIAPLPCQIEILDSIPETLPDNEYYETAKQLSKLLDENDELSGAVINCLNAFNLENDIRAQVQDRILSKILAGTSTKIFPVLLEFLINDNKSQNLTSILFKIRNALDSIMLTNQNDPNSMKILIFNKLEKITTKMKSELWLTVIGNIKLHTDHRPIDHLILFMLHSTMPTKRHLIESTYRKRVKDGLFKCGQLEKLFEKYLTTQLLKNYFKSIIEIGKSLLRTSNELLITEFASTLFKILFNHQYTETIYQRQLLDSLISIIGSEHKNTSVLLKIFTDLLLQDVTKIQQHSILFMKLVEKLDTHELKDIKEIFEILCSLTCNENSDQSGLKDEIHMIIRKQLSSSKKTIKHAGIISAVVMVKHIAKTDQDQNDLNTSIDAIVNLNHLPDGRPKEAACLLELANTCVDALPELKGLYYDQLAAMLMTKDNLDKHFSIWLYETMTTDFQTIFVTEQICESINDLEFSIQYNLNTTDEINVVIAINIAELTLKPTNDNSIITLSPLFRLLRLLHYRQHNGDLATIDALLGCGVVLPKTDFIEQLESQQIKQIADCLFHCINWFREIISGFVKQKNKKIRIKVIQRLNQLIDLEKLLNSCLQIIPEHKLPMSYFDSSHHSKQTSCKVEKITKPKKKVKSKETIDETEMSTSAAVRTVPTRKVTIQEYDVNFREIDTDIVTLLKYPLNFDGTPLEEQITINLQQLKFILKDFVTKLKILTKGKNVGLSHLSVVSPVDIITDCILILPNINNHLNVIVEKINNLLEQTEGRHDLPEILTEEAQDIKFCFNLILESLSLLFSWTGFQHSKKIDLLKDILKSLDPKDEQSSLISANRLISDLVNRLHNYTDQCLNLKHAVNLVKIMESLNGLIPNEDVKKKIAKTSEKLLSKRWYNDKGNLDSGKLCSENIDLLVKSYLSNATTKKIHCLINQLEEEVTKLKAKDDCLPMLPSIHKLNFPIFFRNLCNFLQNRIKLDIQSLTNNEHLILWKTTALTMQSLMSIAKSIETKSILVCFFKKSIAILKIFLSHGIPIMEIILRSKPDDVVEVLKTIQISTRFLHNLCCHSKFTKDQSLMAHVPQFRLTLETLVYRVKAALVANDCSAAFWMGNLKNRDLHGEDIASQNTTSEEKSDDNDEEMLPEDDESDEDLFNEEDDKSTSDVYE